MSSEVLSFTPQGYPDQLLVLPRDRRSLQRGAVDGWGELRSDLAYHAAFQDRLVDYVVIQFKRLAAFDEAVVAQEQMVRLQDRHRDLPLTLGVDAVEESQRGFDADNHLGTRWFDKTVPYPNNIECGQRHRALKTQVLPGLS